MPQLVPTYANQSHRTTWYYKKQSNLFNKKRKKKSWYQHNIYRTQLDNLSLYQEPLHYVETCTPKDDVVADRSLVIIFYKITALFLFLLVLLVCYNLSGEGHI
jgi:hypothetical protein